MTTLRRIKERKLFQWAAAYLAGAWLALEVLSLLASPFAWPDLVLRAATVLLGIGFFGVLVLAWYHGEQGRQRASGVELLMLTGILLVAGMAVSVVAREGDARPEETPAVAAGSPGAGGQASAGQAERGSIAVLPFANLSSDPEQEYFSDGLTEELLNVLAKIPELRVAARTSSFSFKGRNVPVDSVARALRVGHLLEGSVRKAGDQVRITAQLIDAGSGFHVWSETYERSLDDVFAVQDEISRAVAAQLRIELAGGGPLAVEATADPEAHTLVLRGMAVYQQGTREVMAEAERLFREATLRDPGYAQAYARLANVLMLQASYRYIPRDDGYAEARAMAERALEIDPDQSDAHAVLGRLADTYEWRFAAAEEHFRHAVDSNQGDARARSLYAWMLMRLGRTEESLREALRSVELDPLSMAAFNNLGAMYAYSGQPQRSVEAYEIALSLAPGSAVVGSNLALSYLDVGRKEDALRMADSARALDPEDQYSLTVAGYVRARLGRRAEAEQTLAQLWALPEAGPYLIATLFAGLGDRESAFHWLERAVDTRDDVAPDLGLDPVFAEYRGDPRMRRLLQRIGLE